jgi:hypothetical protein
MNNKKYSKICQAYALRMLNQASDTELIQAGVASLEEGEDSPSLRILAGLQDSYDSAFYFKKACDELKLFFSDNIEAANFLIDCWVQEIIEGKLEPMDGCRKIIWKIYYNAGELVVSKDEKIAGESIGLSEFVGIYLSYDELEYGDRWYEKEKRMVTPVEGKKILDKEVLEFANQWINNKLNKVQ